MGIWHKLSFGKHREKTLPQVLFIDPDYFFWAVENDVFYGRFGPQASRLVGLATNIVLRDRKPGTYLFEWFWTPRRQFSHVEVIAPDKPLHVGSSRTRRTDRLDLSVLRNAKEYDKGGYKRLLRQVRLLLFGEDAHRLTRARCHGFFNDKSNFARPLSLESEGSNDNNDRRPPALKERGQTGRTTDPERRTKVALFGHRPASRRLAEFGVGQKHRAK